MSNPGLLHPSQARHTLLGTNKSAAVGMFPPNANLDATFISSFFGYFFFTVDVQNSVNRIVNPRLVKREQGTSDEGNIENSWACRSNGDGIVLIGASLLDECRARRCKNQTSDHDTDGNRASLSRGADKFLLHYNRFVTNNNGLIGSQKLPDQISSGAERRAERRREGA